MQRLTLTQLTEEELTDLVRAEVARQLEERPEANPAPGPAEDPNQLMNKKEAADLLSVSPSTIDNHARAGKLTRHYIGKSVRFRREEVLTLAKPTERRKRLENPQKK